MHCRRILFIELHSSEMKITNVTVESDERPRKIKRSWLQRIKSIFKQNGFGFWCYFFFFFSSIRLTPIHVSFLDVLTSKNRSNEIQFHM